VFATQDLKPGLCIPVVGRKITKEEFKILLDQDRAQYVFEARSQLLDGKWSCRGLEIALKINEPPPHTRANCAFGGLTVQIRRPIAQGEELLVHYGEHYQRNYKVGLRCLHLPEPKGTKRRVSHLWGQV